IATGDGLMRYRSGDGALRKFPEVFVQQGSGYGTNVFRLFEDSQGDIWWSTSSRILNTLGRWNSAQERMEFFSDMDGLPTLQSNLPSAFVEDSSGALWMGFEGQGFARWRRDGRFEY